MKYSAMTIKELQRCVKRGDKGAAEALGILAQEYPFTNSLVTSTSQTRLVIHETNEELKT